MSQIKFGGSVVGKVRHRTLRRSGQAANGIPHSSQARLPFDAAIETDELRQLLTFAICAASVAIDALRIFAATPLMTRSRAELVSCGCAGRGDAVQRN